MEITLQVAGKREPDQEAEAQAWIEAVVGERFRPGVPYEEVLRDGKLMNRLQPGLIPKINYKMISASKLILLMFFSSSICHL